MKASHHPKRIAERYGAYIAVALISFFLICYFLGVIHLAYLRLVNFVILAIGVYMSMRQFQLTHGDKVNYFRAMAIGITSIFVGATAFVFFTFIIFKIDHDIFVSAVKLEPMGAYLNVYIATVAIWIECIFAGVLATYIMVNFIETDN